MPLHVYEMPGTYDVTVSARLDRQLPSEYLLRCGGRRDGVPRSAGRIHHLLRRLSSC